MRWFLILLLLLTGGAHAANRMAGHPSPYLALHAGDATDWRVWDAAALREAKRSNRLVMVSLGYFACHWCHVMQRETWADPDAARLINRHFIPVKVDRETHTALDARLQRFAQQTRQRSGWPLTVFLTPDGDPLYAMLYEPRDEFMRIAEALAGRWREDAAGLTALAREAARPPSAAPRVALPADFERAARGAMDPLLGGFGDGAKFPLTPRLDALLVLEARRPLATRREFLRGTLDHMAAGGLRDHVGGGFFRYTVDPAWQEPHFEKMLYDNAQLARLYLDAARVLQEPAYLEVARDTLDFLLAGMAEGAAYAASLSALDGDGVEGGAYLWQDDTLRGLLADDEYAVVARVWGLHLASPFPGHLPLRHVEPETHEREIYARALQRLRHARGERAVPRDGKLLAGWNGLALSALAAAADLDPAYRRAADALFAFARDTLMTPQGLRKGVAAGQSLGVGELEDYAYLARGLLDYAAATDTAAARSLAALLVRQAWSRFRGPRGLRLEASSLVSGEADAWHDGNTPAPAALLVATTLELDEPRTRRLAEAELKRALRDARGDALDYPSLARIAAGRAP